MSIETDHLPEVEPEVEQPNRRLDTSSNGRAGALTPLEEVRQALAQQTEEKSLDLRLPRNDPPISARYRVIDPDEVEGDTAFAANISMLSVACQGLFLVKEKDELVPLQFGDDPVTYATAADALGFEAASTREAILYLFKDNKIALGTHADRVTTWMTDTSQEVEGQVMGESSG